MWFIILLFIFIGIVAFFARSPKTLVILAVVFSFISALYTSFWPLILILLLTGVATLVYDKKENKQRDERYFFQDISGEVEEETEMEDLLRRLYDAD